MAELIEISNETSNDYQITIDGGVVVYTPAPSINIIWYTADGTEGSAIVIDGSLVFTDVLGAEISPDLTDKTVTEVNKESRELKPTQDFPSPKQFQWAGETPTLTFANDLEEGDQIKITYV